MQLSEKLGIVNKRLEKAPQGTIIFHGKGKHLWFSVSSGSRKDGNKQDQYISVKDKKTLKRYLNKKYCVAMKKLIETELKVLESFLEAYKPEQKYTLINQFPERVRSEIDVVVKTYKELGREWESMPYKKKPEEIPEHLQFVTKKGERVRSKTELIIANLLYDLGIPYRYECALIINGKIFYPDFTIFNPLTGEIFYWEHFGMMDEKNYCDNAISKMNLFGKTDLYPNFIFSFESKDRPVNAEVLRNIMRCRLGV